MIEILVWLNFLNPIKIELLNLHFFYLMYQTLSHDYDIREEQKLVISQFCMPDKNYATIKHNLSSKTISRLQLVPILSF